MNRGLAVTQLLIVVRFSGPSTSTSRRPGDREGAGDGMGRLLPSRRDLRPSSGARQAFWTWIVDFELEKGGFRRISGAPSYSVCFGAAEKVVGLLDTCRSVCREERQLVFGHGSPWSTKSQVRLEAVRARARSEQEGARTNGTVELPEESALDYRHDIRPGNRKSDQAILPSMPPGPS